MIHFTHCFTQGKRQMYRELLSNLTALAETDLGECDPANIAGCTGTILGKDEGNLYKIISSIISFGILECHFKSDTNQMHLP